MYRSKIGSLALLALAFTTACQQFVPPPGQPFRPSGLSRVGIQASQHDFIDDSDLSPLRADFQSTSLLQQEAIKKTSQSMTFKAVPLNSSIQTQRLRKANDSGLSGEFVYADYTGKLVPGAHATVTVFSGSAKVAQTQTDKQGRWQVNLKSPGQYRIEFSLENAFWKIDKYKWEGPTVQAEGATHVGTYTLQKGTKNAEAAYIHDMYNRALNLFEREDVSLNWWKKQINTVWPGSGNYYGWGTVNLTHAEAWDVNGHEIGHAIYAQGINARSQGGQHKIDECYNGTLALSEGFATFFSGAINLEKNDPDARFGDFLVPRRKPIRMENVPEDVCHGNRNEWRVSSVLWDLYDTHEDGQDNFAMPLKDMWSTFSQSNKPAMSSVLDAHKLLQEKLPGEAQDSLNKVFKQNTMEIQ